jgi:hypothetical protein
MGRIWTASRLANHSQAGCTQQFCPACPQVGINLPEDWKDDPNRPVYRRVVTVDGNFKANHVQQHSAADDVWLSDGLGMTTTNSEYNTFLETAWDCATVSVTSQMSSKSADVIHKESTL